MSIFTLKNNSLDRAFMDCYQFYCTLVDMLVSYAIMHINVYLN